MKKRVRAGMQKKPRACVASPPAAANDADAPAVRHCARFAWLSRARLKSGGEAR